MEKLKTIAKVCLPAASSFHSSTSASPLKYIVRQATEEDFMMVTKLRAKELWNISNDEDIDAWCGALSQASKTLGFHVIVAAEEADQKVGPEIYGTLNLLVGQNAMADVHNGRVPDEWKSDVGSREDAYLTELAVSSFARRQGIAQTLLIHAKEVALSKKMKRLFAEVDPGNQAVIDLNKKLGFQDISYNPGSNLSLMGMKLY